MTDPVWGRELWLQNTRYRSLHIWAWSEALLKEAMDKLNPIALSDHYGRKGVIHNMYFLSPKVSLTNLLWHLKLPTTTLLAHLWKDLGKVVEKWKRLTARQHSLCPTNVCASHLPRSTVTFICLPIHFLAIPISLRLTSLDFPWALLSTLLKKSTEHKIEIIFNQRQFRSQATHRNRPWWQFSKQELNNIFQMKETLDSSLNSSCYIWGTGVKETPLQTNSWWANAKSTPYFFFPPFSLKK